MRWATDSTIQLAHGAQDCPNTCSQGWEIHGDLSTVPSVVYTSPEIAECRNDSGLDDDSHKVGQVYF